MHQLRHRGELRRGAPIGPRNRSKTRRRLEKHRKVPAVGHPDQCEGSAQPEGLRLNHGICNAVLSMGRGRLPRRWPSRANLEGGRGSRLCEEHHPAGPHASRIGEQRLGDWLQCLRRRSHLRRFVRWRSWAVGGPLQCTGHRNGYWRQRSNPSPFQRALWAQTHCGAYVEEGHLYAEETRAKRPNYDQIDSRPLGTLCRGLGVCHACMVESFDVGS
mmetsp:Transcript_41988/g.90174  ORF Transcript_41988/g.90174 Transcript_41988/m.90174 type:complete len:216 (-) Transcript_41988:1075-1722(-)